jgi:tetratricopeptide (TPR) repeat protein
MARRLLIALALGLAACRRGDTGPAPGASSSSVIEEARILIAQGDADTALARLQGAPQTDGEVLLLEGLAWARKAETAPLPVPAPGAAAAASPLKPEEVQALGFFERACEAQPDLAAAHLAVADLLAPHVLRREAQERALAGSRSRGATARPRDETPMGVPAPGPELSVERVLQAYRRAAQADRNAKPVVEAWIDFARKAGRLDEAEAGFQQLLLRDKENAAPFMRYGDFLAAERKDHQGAIAQYSQALIWQPSLDEARAKIADIYLEQAAGHYDRKEYATAQARLADARRYVGSGDTPQAARLRQLQAQLAQIRGR